MNDTILFFYSCILKLSINKKAAATTAAFVLIAVSDATFKGGVA